MRALGIFSACAILIAAILFNVMQHSPSAGTKGEFTLAGRVASAEEGPMEGVLVTATRTGSPVHVTVTTDANGQYGFPADRLASGSYRLEVRAIGFELTEPANAEVKSGTETRTDMSLSPTQNLAAQMTNAEWMMSVPGTPEQKLSLIDCTGCHTLQRVVESSYDEREFGAVLQRMSTYSFVSFWKKPQLRPNVQNSVNLGEGGPGLPEQFKSLARYLATINHSKGEPTWKMLTLPRPSGRATRVIVTSYDLPSEDIQPHDVIVDEQGFAWYSNFSDMTIGRIDPKSGAHKEWRLPTLKPNAPVGTLDLERDANGVLWIGMMHQGAIASFDPKAEKFRVYPLPSAWNDDDVRISMLTAPKPGSKLLWILNQGNNDILRLDIETGAMTRSKPLGLLPIKTGPHAIYGIESDDEDNLYFTEFFSHYLGRIDAKTGAVRYLQTPSLNTWPRRLKKDGQGRFTVGEWHGGRVAAFDPNTETFIEYPIKTPFSGAYDAVADRNGEFWTGGMTTDRIARINPKTGEQVEYLMPISTNLRRVFVDNKTSPVTFWVGANHSAAILRIETLD